LLQNLTPHRSELASEPRTNRNLEADLPVNHCFVRDAPAQRESPQKHFAYPKYCALTRCKPECSLDHARVEKGDPRFDRCAHGCPVSSNHEVFRNTCSKIERQEVRHAT